jgi:hypothetical protein
VDRNIGLVSQYVGAVHGAVKVDENVREGLLKFNEARGQPNVPRPSVTANHVDG